MQTPGVVDGDESVDALTRPDLADAVERQRRELSTLAAALAQLVQRLAGADDAIASERRRRLEDLAELDRANERTAHEAAAARAARELLVIERAAAAESPRGWRRTVATVRAHLPRLHVDEIPVTLQRDVELVRQSPLFDAKWYLAANADVAAAGIEPALHFVYDGASEGRAASPRFDTAWYRDSNPDVVAEGVNPLVHYLERGCLEGRLPVPPEKSTP